PINEKVKPLDIDLIVHAVNREFSIKRIKRSLIIFDNAPENFMAKMLKMQLPSNTDILITSNHYSWETKILLTDPAYRLTTEEGVQLLRSWIGDRVHFDAGEAEKIVKRFAH